MVRQRLGSGLVLAILLAAGTLWQTQRVLGQVPRADRAVIASLTEQGQGLLVQQTASDGRVEFAGDRSGRGILLSTTDTASPEIRARNFVGIYGQAFGVSEYGQLELTDATKADEVGIEHVRFKQMHLGVPVVGGAMVVHLKGRRALAANGKIIGNLPATVTPRTTPSDASRQARQVVAKLQQPGEPVAYSEPRLEILDKSLLESSFAPPRTAWFVEATSVALREFIWVDAETGSVLHHFSQLTDAKSRSVYTAANTSTLPGTLVRSEGGAATGDADTDNAYDYAGATYDYYSTQHSRDSYNNAGAALNSTVHYCESGSCPNYANAFWNGSQMVYGNGFASADDVVAHELTHAVTENSANLLYSRQSGALNESFSDIFGEAVDLADGLGNDAAGVRWSLGEDLSIGAIRNMLDPTIFSDPGKMSDAAYFVCSEADNGGVHTNSGVPNHAFALMTDGGTYNGRTMSGIGLTKAAKIEYRALTYYLTSGSGFQDDYTALNQSCTDLVGTAGITASDCTQVKLALDAVEMNRPWPCSGAIMAPPLCPTGAAPTSSVFSDSFEAGAGNWSGSSSSPATWSYLTGQWAKGGLKNLYAPDPAYTSDHQAYMTAGVVVPVGGRLYFDNAFEFEYSNGGFWDGGVVEYSAGGGSWTDAGSLIEAGQAYGGTISAAYGNPIGGRSAFVHSSFGYSGTRLNLSSLAGQSVRIRFRVGSDSSTSALGWSVDNVQIYRCDTGTNTANLALNGNFTSGTTNWLTYALPAAGDMVSNVTGGVFQWYRVGTQAVVFQETGMAIPTGGPLEATFDIGNSTTVRKRISVLMHNSDFADLSVCTFTMEPGAALSTYRMRTHTTRAWTNATISFYAANTGNEGGGFYRLDNVVVQYVPATTSPNNGADLRTECVDPTAPASGGSTSANLMSNGTFTSVITPWATFGNISSQLSSGVFEFFKLTGLPSGVLLQNTSQAMANDQRMTATFQLGNSSGLRQRVTVLLHEGDFSDITACTFFLPPGLPLSNYAMRIYATKAWTNATMSFYPATVGTAPTAQWLRLDNVTLIRSTTAAYGTECFEPGTTPAAPAPAPAPAPALLAHPH